SVCGGPQPILGRLHGSVHQGRDAKDQGHQPHPNTGDTDAPTGPQVPRVHQLHHSQVAVNTHAGKEEDVGEAVHSDDVAAEFAQHLRKGSKVPVSILARRHGPQRQGENKDQVGQGQVDDKGVHQTRTSRTFAGDH
uniref:Uncharacterized protein n=1 Tax=Mastacembelus armatus TaxID=205130 RepID=A0A3Q3RS23_9TELE